MTVDLASLRADGTAVMGIVNATPDSFSGDGILLNSDAVETAVDQARRFLNAGCQILDIGGESTRPGSEPLDVETELARVIPVINAIREEHSNALISIDTYKGTVAEAALEAGADIINDVWGGRADPQILASAARHGCPIILMHNRAKWGAAQHDTKLGSAYDSPAIEDGDTEAFLNACLAETAHCVRKAQTAGISLEKIIVDPGIGFGKSVEQNLALVTSSERFRRLAPTILIGSSRKNFIGKVLDAPVEERLFGTAATVAIAAYTGADIVRVHDVEEMKDVVTMANAFTHGAV